MKVWYRYNIRHIILKKEIFSPPEKEQQPKRFVNLASTSGMQIQHPSKFQATNERWTVLEQTSSTANPDICGAGDSIDNGNTEVQHPPEANTNNLGRRSIGVQASPILESIKNRSKSVMAKLKAAIRSKGLQCTRSPMKKFQDTGTTMSPIKSPEPPPCRRVPLTPDQYPAVSNDESTSLSTEESSGSSYRPSGDRSKGGDSGGKRSAGGISKQAFRELHINRVKDDPMYYIGISPEYYYLVDQLGESVQTDVVSVLICIQKIRLNQTFKGLANDYAVSEYFCSKVFCKVVPYLAKCLDTLILWPDKKKTIKRRLPLYFSARYFNVQSIIDCFEIEIEKPSNPVNQTLSWSNYKKANTLKYFISCTPDGYINFVSGGYWGRTSDAKITESCGYLDVLPVGCSVMADRGFKGIAAMLERKKCSLVRPPSVSASEQCTKNQVKLSKRIASLRIHIERVIRRLREYNMLKPHACINHHLLKYTDCVVKIVSGLVNLQSPLIKKYA